MQFLRQLLDMLLTPIRAVLSSPAQLVSNAGRVRSISLAAKIALLTFFVLVLAVVLYVFIYPRIAHHVPEAQKWTPKLIGIISLLIVIITLVVYLLVTYLLEKDISHYSDIDDAWRIGLAELAAQGIDLAQTPLFLVVGSGDEYREQALFNASQLSFRVHDCPEGRAALHWYAGPEGVYLVASDVGSLSALVALSRKNRDSGPQRVPAANLTNIKDTLMLVKARHDLTAVPAGAPAPAARAASPAAAPSPALGGTIMVGDLAPPPGAPALPNAPVPHTMSLRDAEEQKGRLAYLCHLIRQHREPLCPINGVLALLPFELIVNNWEQELGLAAQRDMRTLFHHLNVCCQTVVLVTGMDQESGFRELVRRVGRDKALNQRFGKGNSSVWNRPTAMQLKLICDHACGAFESFIYELFRDKGALTKPGNTKLFSLLCTIRSRVHAALKEVLSTGFSVPDDHPEEGLLMAGCYFAATGNADGRQAFVRSTVAKLYENHSDEDVAWSQAALDSEARFASWAQVLFWIDIGLVASLVGMIAWNYFGRH